MQKLLIGLSDEDHALVAAYAHALGLPSIDAGASRIIAEWAGRYRIREQARRRSKLPDPRRMRGREPQG